MPVGLSQDERVASLTTPLPKAASGKDILGLTRFDGGEGLSELFEFRVEAVSEQQNIDFNPAIGRNCHVEFRAPKDVKRFFNGVLVEAQWIGVRDYDHVYRLVLRPWLWLISHSANCRIFRDKNVPDIIKEVFDKAGFPDFRLKPGLTEDYPIMEYCVQYRETDLAFVSRLMEQYGIYYYFEHSAEKHTLVLADSSTSHSEIPGGVLTYNPVLDPYFGEREHIYHWMPERRFRTGKVALIDYDYLEPNAELQLLTEAKGSERYNKSDLEVYDFPGKYPRKDENTRKDAEAGERLAKVRLQAEQALDHRRHAAGRVVSLFPGALFRLEDHPCDEENQQYLAVRATHSFSTQHYRSSGMTERDDGYYGHYELLPNSSSRPFRAPLVTPKPVIYGPQTAKVVDKDGNDQGSDDIDVDKHGRIHVRFHWDRDKGPSRRVRVAQVWSGDGWGGQFIPRLGMEVVIEFLEGDPDRPLVIGTVYNDKNTYPFNLEEQGNKRWSGLRSDSTPSRKGYNEIHFEDETGAEKFYLRAEHDHEILVQHDEKRQIDNDWLVNVGNRITVEAGTQIILKVGMSTITMKPESIAIESLHVDVKGSVEVVIQGGFVKIN